MSFNFNAVYNRRDSDSEKWNNYAADVLPMWVADSDYAVPSEIITALKQRLEHPLLGYGREPQQLRELIVNRLASLYNWHIEPQWICFTPGVVGSLNACRAIMGKPGSKAVTALPVYPHLQNPTPILERPMQFFRMLDKDGRYTPDFSELRQVIDDDTRMLMLCNPHNPVGTVYNDAELKAFADIADANDLIICSDDIHADFALYDDKPYRPIASLSPSVSKRTITLMAASKTFNIAGLNCSYAIIEDSKLRQLFSTQLKGLLGGVNVMGFIATTAAYEHGEAWLQAQRQHLREQAEYCHQRINTMPYVSMNAMEATYLAWVDVTQVNKKIQAEGKSGGAYQYFLANGVAVSDGDAFGDGNFVRLNLATDRALLQQGLDSIASALAALGGSA